MSFLLLLTRHLCQCFNVCDVACYRSRRPELRRRPSARSPPSWSPQRSLPPTHSHRKRWWCPRLRPCCFCLLVLTRGSERRSSRREPPSCWRGRRSWRRRPPSWTGGRERCRRWARPEVSALQRQTRFRVLIRQLQSRSLACFCFRQEKQLAAPAGEVPSGSLFLPRHHGGHPSRVPEDGPDHVLPVDVWVAASVLIKNEETLVVLVELGTLVACDVKGSCFCLTAGCCCCQIQNLWLQRSSERSEKSVWVPETYDLKVRI